VDGEVSISSHSSYLDVHVTGSIFLKLEIGEQLAWLGCVCRMGSFADRLTSVTPTVLRLPQTVALPATSSERLSPLISFDIRFALNPIKHINDGTCWGKLFRNMCVAEDFPISLRRGEKLGLELPFDMMAQLGGAHRVAYWNGRLVLKGFETLFVPVKKDGACISWHLVTKANCRRISFNAAGDLGEGCEQQVFVEDLLSSRHFLGWVPRASQHAGMLC
jgi:hypothetical protein